MRVVLDTNILVSGTHFGGKPRAVLQAMGSGRCTLIVSREILAELEGVLLNKFHWDRAAVRLTLSRILMIAETVRPQQKVTDCVDPDDNRILEAAVEGDADCVVSGDDHLLRIGRFRGIDILTAGDFLSRLASES